MTVVRELRNLRRHRRPDLVLKELEGRVGDSTGDECKLETDVTSVFGDGADVPDLVHRGDGETEAAAEGEDGGDAPRQLAGLIPVGDVVVGKVAAAEDEVLFEEDGNEGCCPVANEAEEIGEGRNEAVSASDTKGNDTAEKNT